jgi:hypothetical protein
MQDIIIESLIKSEVIQKLCQFIDFKNLDWTKKVFIILQNLSYQQNVRKEIVDTLTQ